MDVLTFEGSSRVNSLLRSNASVRLEQNWGGGFTCTEGPDKNLCTGNGDAMLPFGAIQYLVSAHFLIVAQSQGRTWTNFPAAECRLGFAS